MYTCTSVIAMGGGRAILDLDFFLAVAGEVCLSVMDLFPLILHLHLLLRRFEKPLALVAECP